MIELKLNESYFYLVPSICVHVLCSWVLFVYDPVTIEEAKISM